MLRRKLIFLVLLLSLVGDASAATRWFYPSASSGIWNDADNWTGGLPTIADTANLNRAGKTCLVDANHTGGSAAVCSALWLPSYMEDGPGTCYLNMTGGTITVGNNFEMGRWASRDDVGELNLSGGTINIGGELHVGARNAGDPNGGGDGTINMTGGLIDVSGLMQVPKSTGGGSTGTINLDGGVIEVNSIFMDSNGLLDINEGTLIIDGNVVNTINSYVSSGWITAYNGNGEVNVDYGITNPAQTTVTGTAPTPGKATNPSPTDTATNVNLDTNLSWTAGPNTSSHDVYLGTSSSNVTNANTSSAEFKGNQASTTYDPPSDLDGSTTYYWRIDEVNDIYSTTAKGDTWSFTTVTPTGQQVWFNPTGTTGRWDDGNDWTPNDPNSLDTANINRAGKTCIIDSNNTGGNAAVCKILWLPSWMEDGPGTCYLNMTGGTITVDSNIEMGRWGSRSDTGELNLSGGTITVGGELHVGGKNPSASTGGTGTINITGGTIDVSGALKVPVATATGTVNLNGGTLEANSISMDSNGLIDIAFGNLIIDGNVISTINSYVSSSWITAYNGTGTVNIDYGVTNPGQTTVTGITAGVTGVLILCSASDKQVTVTYDVNSSLEVRAFALDITVDSGAVITDVNNFNSDYWVYPGSIDVNQTTEQIDDYGSAICDGNLVGTLPGLDSNGVTIEMASLYVGEANAPANSGTLFQFTVDKACTVTIAENRVRDGVVLKGGAETDPNITGCTVE
jgi:hypothetical protein